MTKTVLWAFAGVGLFVLTAMLGWATCARRPMSGRIELAPPASDLPPPLQRGRLAPTTPNVEGAASVSSREAYIEALSEGLPLQHVVCPLPDHDGSSGHVLVRREDGTLPDPPWLGSYSEGGIELYVTEGAEVAVFEMPDRTLLLTWDANGCRTTRFAEKAGLQGRVRGSLPFAESWVDGCGSKAPIDADNQFFFVVPTVPCTIQVVARDRGRVASGPVLEVAPRAGVELDVVLEAPTAADLRPWTDDEYAALLEMIELSRALAEGNTDEPWYSEQFATWEALRAEVETARAGP